MRAALWLSSCLLAALAGAPAHAQTAPGPSYIDVAASFVQDSLAREPAEGGALKTEFQMGALDARLRLAPCGNVEAYLPLGSRLWGKSRVGLRCVDGMSRWNVMVPVTVKATGPAWVVRQPVASGAVLKTGDLVEADVDWAEESQAVVKNQSDWLGQTATRHLQTGQTLRVGMSRPAQVFAAGTTVRVVAQGPGFVISSEAQALSGGVIGQTARVKMDNGRVTSGTVLDVRTVKIEL